MTNSGKAKKMKNPRNKKPKSRKTQATIGAVVDLRTYQCLGGGAPVNIAPACLQNSILSSHGEACAADIYRALGEEIERLNEERMGIKEKPFRRPNYASFSRYFHWFLILGLIERTDRQEPAIYDFLEKRVFYRLTRRGKSEVSAWEDPVRAAHPEFG